LLTVFIHEREDNYKIIYAILSSSQLIYWINEDEKKKVFLA
jgi:hypothetical protein